MHCFVQAKAAGNLNITNAVRPSVYQDTRFYRTDEQNGEEGEQGAKEGLIKLAILQNGKLDETAIYFERGATQKFDGKFDALKIHSYFTKKGGLRNKPPIEKYKS